MSHGISIGCDMHKRYSVFAVLDENGEMSAPTRIEHHRDDLAVTTSKRSCVAFLQGRLSRLKRPPTGTGLPT